MLNLDSITELSFNITLYKKKFSLVYLEANNYNI